MKKSDKKTSMVIAIVLFVVLLGIEIGFTHERFKPHELTKSYNQYVTETINHQYRIFGYLKHEDSLTLKTYFLNEKETSIISSLETTYGTIVYHDVVSSDIEVDKHVYMQYGFNSHMEVNIIIKTTKDLMPSLISKHFTFSYIDNFEDFDYYIAAYYGKTRERNDLTYTINRHVYNLTD